MRWENEKNLHVFTDTFSEQEAFNEWFYKNVLCGKSIDKVHFDKVFQRYVYYFIYGSFVSSYVVSLIMIIEKYIKSAKDLDIKHNCTNQDLCLNHICLSS